MKYKYFGCSSLTSVTIPNSVTSIGLEAFSGCSGLTSVTILCEKVDSWFGGIKSIKEVILGDSVTSIGESAFYHCSGLTSVTIPNSVSSIGSGVFSGCSGLTSVTIPNSVTSIGNYAFFGCSGLTSVTIGDGITSIGSGAFEGCSGLTSVTIGNSVTSIEYNAFSGCSNLTSVAIHCKEVGSWFSGIGAIKEIVLGDSVTSIGIRAFEGCSGLTSVTIGNSVTSIGESAFYGCSGLTSVTIGNSVTSIGVRAFYGCSGLTSVTIPNSVTSIGKWAFWGCSGLTSINIPNSVTSIGGSAFNICSGLKSVTINCKNVGSWFSRITSIKEVVLGDGVKSIGSSAFEGCGGLTSVTIGDGVTSIGGSAFEGCGGLTSVTIPNGVTSIGESAFSGCSGLTSVTIPNSVTSIGVRAFYGCNCLTSVTIPNGVTSIGYYAFRDCSGLTSVTIHCKKVDSWFKGMTSIKEVVLGDSVISIGNDAFRDCSNLTSVTIGNRVKTIGEFAFPRNNMHVKLLGYNPPELILGRQEKTFSKVEVPKGSTCRYAQAQNWQEADVIYAVDGDTFLYPIPIIREGENVVSINGHFEGYEAKEGEEVTIELCSSLDNALIMKGTQNMTNILSEKGSFSIVSSKFHFDNVINTYKFPLTSIVLSESGTLLDKVNINELQNIENLKISGDINGTDLLVLRKMENLKLLDLSDAHIVNGGASYYEHYVTSKNVVGTQFFNNGRKLYTVKLPNDIIEIGDKAFYGLKELKTITIPKSVTWINQRAFLDCSNLASVYIEDLAGYCTMRFGNNASWYHEYPDIFSGRYDLYLNDVKIVDLVIPNEVTTISRFSFYFLERIKSLFIHSKVTEIGEKAFDYCYIEESITCLNPTPPEIGEQTFFYGSQSDNIYERVTLYVPKGSKTLYWLHPYWEKFNKIEEIEVSGILQNSNNLPQTEDGYVYNIKGERLTVKSDGISTLPKGIYIKNGKKVIIK